ncbi:MAG: PAC2 family protein [Deltaproteobacteria bacterium]|nr:PAC2 family protein [Deltaproteobacteria bacterium]
MDDNTGNELCYLDNPDLNQPVMIMGFSGWPNAGEISSGVVTFLVQQLEANPLASVEADSFFDFTSLRPEAIIENGLASQPVLPGNEFFYVKGHDGTRDLILFVGNEPHLRWDAFTDLVIGLSEKFDVSRIYTLGGTYVYLPHWLEPSVSVVFSDENSKSAFTPLSNLDNLNAANYNGPISIHNVILTRAFERGFPVVGLWGHAPFYIHTGNFRVHLSLVNILTQVVNFKIDTNELLENIADMEANIAESMEENPKLRDFINDLEEEYGRETITPAPTSLMGSDPPMGKVISIDEFLKRERTRPE